eukprot:jgi/Botrbrau1/5071/Bobra.37_1s0035.1
MQRSLDATSGAGHRFRRGCHPGPTPQPACCRPGQCGGSAQAGGQRLVREGAPRDWPRAAQLYAYAAKLRDAQASFNLGFMQQFRAGLPQDLALAKRYYDKAGEWKQEAWLPVSLALFALDLHSKWLTIRPALPSWGDFIWNRIFALQDPGSTVAPLHPADTNTAPKFGLGLGWVDKVVESILGGNQVEAGEPTWDNLETLLLVLMCGGLWLILWRRRSLRQQAALVQPQPQGQPQAAQNAQVGPAVAPPGGGRPSGVPDAVAPEQPAPAGSGGPTPE